MIDLTKMTLEEVQNLVTETRNGMKVRIYANYAGGGYPIHGAIYNGEWHTMSWRENGSFNTVIDKASGNDLKISKKTIDFSKLPKDTLVAWDGNRYFTTGVKQRNWEIALFVNELCSQTSRGWVTVPNSELTLLTGEPMPWFGGRCPLPDGVEVKIWYRGKHVKVITAKHGSEPQWLHHGYFAGSEIIAYQITGNIV